MFKITNTLSTNWEKNLKFDLDDSQINSKWPLAKEGLPFIFAVLALSSVLLFLGLFFLSGLAGLISLFIVYFFRDPNRKNGFAHNAVLSPADGKILEIKHINNNDNPLGGPAIKVSIFMSVFNVHVNRIPVGGTIKEIFYRPGKFFSANLDKASKLNESNRIILQTDDSHKIVFIQIAGLIARRIVCWVGNGDMVEAGQRFGLIRFGSRLEVYLPIDSQIIARARQKMKAGETIIGYLS
ncbi:MAG: phosphatidylserine decarboxylase family protein [Desulfobacterales bacterium]|nr:phosphatidylserine decarboxylase family protein [Desulfobacterales bacterium]